MGAEWPSVGIVKCNVYFIETICRVYRCSVRGAFVYLSDSCVLLWNATGIRVISGPPNMRGVVV